MLCATVPVVITIIFSHLVLAPRSFISLMYRQPLFPAKPFFYKITLPLNLNSQPTLLYGKRIITLWKEDFEILLCRQWDNPGTAQL